jgi:hypothetical protein
VLPFRPEIVRRTRWLPLRLVLTAAVVVVLLSLVSAPAGAASPDPPSPAEPAASPGIIGTGDPRSEGEGPGLVGSPVLIALGVLALGAVTIGGTLVYLRLTRQD